MGIIGFLTFVVVMIVEGIDGSFFLVGALSNTSSHFVVIAGLGWAR